MFLREKILENYWFMYNIFEKKFVGNIEEFVCKSLQIDLGKKINYLISTGNLVSQSGLGLMQNSGLSITCERINHTRFISHLKSVH